MDQVSLTFGGIPEVTLALAHEIQVEACAQQGLAIGKRNDCIAIYLVISHSIADCVALNFSQQAMQAGFQSNAQHLQCSLGQQQSSLVYSSEQPLYSGIDMLKLCIER